MKYEFDLTNAKGLTAGIVASQAPNMGRDPWDILGLLIELMKYAIDRVASLLDSKQIMEAQRNTAEDIIKAGENHNVDELEITLDQDAGAKVNLNINGADIVKIKIGNEGKMKIKVKYRQTA
jgi:hypothetical protein